MLSPWLLVRSAPFPSVLLARAPFHRFLLHRAGASSPCAPSLPVVSHLAASEQSAPVETRQHHGVVLNTTGHVQQRHHPTQEGSACCLPAEPAPTGPNGTGWEPARHKGPRPKGTSSPFQSPRSWDTSGVSPAWHQGKQKRDAICPG